MIETIGNRSAKAGYRRSRLPKFTKEQIDYIKGTFDFLGLNTYTTYNVRALEDNEVSTLPRWSNDVMTFIYQSDEWEAGASTWLKVSRNVLDKFLVVEPTDLMRAMQINLLTSSLTLAYLIVK